MDTVAPTVDSDAEGAADALVEQRANDFFARATARGGVIGYAVRHPVDTVRALAAVRRLPVLDAVLSGTGDGPAVEAPLRRSAVSRALMGGATAVVRLPASADDYVAGASKQTLRRKSRAATRAGVTWSLVTDPGRRAELLAIASRNEQESPRAEYRMPEPVFDGLPEIALWLVAWDRDGAPLLLSVTPVDGEWAVLRYFRTLVTNDDSSVARYYASQILAEQLIERGVRYLADSLSPLRVTPGARHFQRMLGYRLVRVRVRVR